MTPSVHDALSRRWRHQVVAEDGFVVVGLDERRVATFKQLHHENTALAQDELLLRYRVRNGVVKFATNAFFFQEGHAQDFQAGRFGQFRVDEKGELLLVTLFDQDLKEL
ncbi:MAG: hypothetical protein CO186_08685 [Zetaproteobacteria bacterium CG_4_9_14_3_um_filter_49_83]|nr:MAG: hypothetical protein COW62_05915 [Zetaproteobacteria bacterium CG17_big_fil_post_rev_8_21_14_2_50_50_13]PIV30045.1 MAG: hypothetical protein COS35_08795 [Zetaproteobacteria bacterium CG02_land_8_20_14_3_00_50_9]PIY56458.1 MAG: hypothetical protein COZ00_04095 [Zetaproteobacteria bacterium CG_4_10_14_0_8_um_filter_49_80]PJA34844.1 MAG: hypothetical protein CO186_08685 [Zetaproteobacteria bacterium CG_4_9_14_3_um_filter_49_83]HCX89809.1 hypothetical protein [Deltaproteobacteria bacterium]